VEIDYGNERRMFSVMKASPDSPKPLPAKQGNSEKPRTAYEQAKAQVTG